MNDLKNYDPEIAEILAGELVRQQDTLILIASENYTSRAVLQVQGGIMTNKYAEGYPCARYYRGCEFVDQAESLAKERVRTLFGADHVNVQPHSGTQANMAAYFALLEPGDKIMGMNISCGGHLSHGTEHSFSGRFYRTAFYGADVKTGRIDYSAVKKLVKEYRPRMIICGYSAYPRIIEFDKWREIANTVDAYLLADIAHIGGLVAAGVHPSPVPYADVVTTTTHKTLRGPRGAVILCRKEYAGKIDRAIFPGIQGGPLMHAIAARAIAFGEALKPEFKLYQEQIVKNARTLAHSLLSEGFKLVSGGTDNHLLLMDLRERELTGKKGAGLLEEAGVIANKNTVPGDARAPAVTSGIRFGTPALTTRGMKESEMKLIARLISQVLHNPEDAGVREKVRGEVKELCTHFPIYEDF